MTPLELLHYRPKPAALRERVLLITGAGQGLGKALALAAADLGATVILHGREVGKLESVYDAIVARGGREPLLLPLDLRRAGEHDFDQMAGAIESQLGALAGIVHCAAEVPMPAPATQYRRADWEQAYQVNVLAPMALLSACERLLRQASDASVVFTGETHGLQPTSFWSVTAATKGALMSLTQVLAQEWAQFTHMRVNMIVPGKINSPQRARTHPGEHASERRSLDEVVPAYLYLLSPESASVSGQIFVL